MNIVIHTIDGNTHATPDMTRENSGGEITDLYEAERVVESLIEGFENFKNLDYLLLAYGDFDHRRYFNPANIIWAEIVGADEFIESFRSDDA